MIPEVRIVSAYAWQDGVESCSKVGEWLTDVTARELRIRALAEGWGDDEDDLFGSGAGPIFAVERAVQLLAGGVDAVVIRGSDMLRSGYGTDERERLMRIFEGETIPEAYTLVAKEWLARHDLTPAEFRTFARLLESNYRLVAEARGLPIDPPGTHDTLVTELFRRVDCAHPIVDFRAELVLTTAEVARRHGLDGPRVTAVATARIPDGPGNARGIACYDHLSQALVRAAELRGRPLENPVDADVALELYTCFPVVPLAFILAAGWVDTPSELTAFLQRVAVTVSGGMNFARAPWNNPALRGLVLVARRVAGGAQLGLVHGNGGLGGKQGVCIIEP